MLAFLCFIIQKVDAQLLEGVSENYWTCVQNVSHNQAVSERIGNYPCLPIHSTDQKKQLLAIAAEKSGTLFIVGKLNRPYIGSLLELGGLVIETNAVHCAESKIESQPLGETPFILKVRYQASPKRKWDASNLSISDALSIAEIVHYNKQLNQEESRKIESYLALKYSVNITQNSQSDLRRYSAVEGPDYWLSSIDGQYSDQVLALGRVDEWNWNQSQTYSADAQTISLSLSPTLNWGNKPKVDLANKSVLVVSQKPSELLENGCQLSSKDFPWKFNFHHWKSPARNLYLSWQSTTQLESPLFFTNGEKTIELQPNEENGLVSVAIPIDQISQSGKETWFLVWNHDALLCDAIGTLNYTYCLEQTQASNTVEMQLTAKALPATFVLRNVQNGAELKGEIDTRRSVLKNIPSGQYKLVVTYAEGLRMEELVRFPSCNQEGETGRDLSKVEQHALPFSEEESTEGLRKAFGNSILLYPNPVREGKSFRADFHADLNGEPFQIEVFDHAGRLIEAQGFTPEEGAVYYQSLQAEGTYFVHFRSASTVVVQRIVVL